MAQFELGIASPDGASSTSAISNDVFFVQCFFRRYYQEGSSISLRHRKVDTGEDFLYRNDKAMKYLKKLIKEATHVPDAE